MFLGSEAARGSDLNRNPIYPCPSGVGGGVLGPKTDGGVPLKIGTKKIQGKMEFGAKMIEFIRIGSFSTPNNRFGIGGWEKVPQMIVFNP